MLVEESEEMDVSIIPYSLLLEWPEGKKKIIISSRLSSRGDKSFLLPVPGQKEASVLQRALVKVAQWETSAFSFPHEAHSIFASYKVNIMLPCLQIEDMSI